MSDDALRAVEAAADKYADGIICYRTTNPRAHRNTVRAAFLAGSEHAAEHPALLDEVETLRARLAAVGAVLVTLEHLQVDHRHPEEEGAATPFGIDGRAYYYAGDIIDAIYNLRAALDSA
jgi:hypothetical protein